jgi:MFS family permease
MEEGSRGMRLVLAAVLAAIVVGGTADLVLDAPTHWRSGHALYEVALILGGVAGAIWLWRNWKLAAESARELRRSLDERRIERDLWRTRAALAIQGLGYAVGQQLVDWELTPVAAYHKAGVGGRAELAAFFLGDLTLPPASAGT